MNLKIDTRVRRLIHYITDIEKGLIQIPEFQRDYIWESKDILELFDSIKRNYPVGSILFWKPEAEEFGKSEKIGPYYIPQENDNYFYVLDGFQRLSTLFGCLINPEKTKLLSVEDNDLKKKFKICYDLENEEFFLPRGGSLEPYQVYIFNLIDTRATFSFLRLLESKNYTKERIETYIDRYEKLGTTIIDFQLPSIDIIGGNIEEAVEIFSRVNSRGKDISTDWMVSALSYNKGNSFKLGYEITNLLNELNYYNWENLKRDVIFNCIINSFGKFYIDQSKKIETVAKRNDFSVVTLKTIASIKKAVKYLFEELLVVEDRLLPYNTQLLFIVDFFNQVENPTSLQLEKLKSWFWQTSLSNYFTIYSLSKQRLAYNHFQNFIKKITDEPLYVDGPYKLSVNQLGDKIYFGSARAKSFLLFLLNHSNDWKPCSSKTVSGFNMQFIAGEHPESVVIFLDDSKKRISKYESIEKLLEDDKPNLFIKQRKHNLPLETYVHYRGKEISDAEIKFAKSIGLEYKSDIKIYIE